MADVSSEDIAFLRKHGLWRDGAFIRTKKQAIAITSISRIKPAFAIESLLIGVPVILFFFSSMMPEGKRGEFFTEFGSWISVIFPILLLAAGFRVSVFTMGQWWPIYVYRGSWFGARRFANALIRLVEHRDL